MVLRGIKRGSVCSYEDWHGRTLKRTTNLRALWSSRETQQKRKRRKGEAFSDFTVSNKLLSNSGGQNSKQPSVCFQGRVCLERREFTQKDPWTLEGHVTHLFLLTCHISHLLSMPQVFKSCQVRRCHEKALVRLLIGASVSLGFVCWLFKKTHRLLGSENLCLCSVVLNLGPWRNLTDAEGSV